MNVAVHSSMELSARSPSRLVTVPLLTVKCEDSDVQRLKRMIKDVSKKSHRRSREVDKRKSRSDKAPVSSLIRVKSETSLPGTCSKL